MWTNSGFVQPTAAGSAGGSVSNTAIHLGGDQSTLNYPSPATAGPSRRQKVHNVVPMQVLDLVQYNQEDGPLTVCGLEVVLVKVIGKVWQRYLCEIRC